MSSPIYSPDGKMVWNGVEWIPTDESVSINSRSDLDTKSPEEKMGFWDRLAKSQDGQTEDESRTVSQKIEDIAVELKSLEQERESLKQQKEAEEKARESSKIGKATKLMENQQWKDADDLATDLYLSDREFDVNEQAQLHFIMGKSQYMLELSKPTGLQEKLYIELAEFEVKESRELFDEVEDEKSILKCMVLLKEIAQSIIEIDQR